MSLEASGEPCLRGRSSCADRRTRTPTCFPGFRRVRLSPKVPPGVSFLA